MTKRASDLAPQGRDKHRLERNMRRAHRFTPLVKMPIGRAAMTDITQAGELVPAEPLIAIHAQDAAEIEKAYKLADGTLAKIIGDVLKLAHAPTAGVRKFLAEWYLDEIDLPKISYLFRGAYERFGLDGARRVHEYCAERNASIANLGRNSMARLESIDAVAKIEANKVKAATNQHAG